VKGQTYIIETEIDGDEWPPTVDENVMYDLERNLERMVKEGYIIGFEIRKPGEHTSDTPPDNSPTQPEPYTEPEPEEPPPGLAPDGAPL